MKVLVIAEGKHELGDDAESSAVATLVRRIIPDAECTCRKVSDPCVQIIRAPGKRVGEYSKRLIRWIGYAAKNGFEALVAIVDEDGQSDRKTGVLAAQLSNVNPIPRAIGIAIRSFDAWMLADEAALSDTLGNEVQRQPSPEGIRDPKAAFRTLLNASGCVHSQAEAYVEILSRIDLMRLKERCRAGFAPFHERLLELGETLAGGGA